MAEKEPQIIRVLIIEAQTLVRLGLKAVLNDASGFVIVGETETSAEGVRLAAELRPDVVLLSLRLKETCAVDDLDKFAASPVKPKIIILATHAGDGEIAQALKKGALGYLLTDVAPADLVTAARTVARGKKYIPHAIASVLTEHLGQEPLTATEQTILRRLTEGQANKEIAYALNVSENTVKTHIKNIFDKLQVSDRTSAATAAIKRGLVRLDR